MSAGIRVKGFFKGITAFAMWCVFRPITRTLCIAGWVLLSVVALPAILCASPSFAIAMNSDVSTFVKVLTAPLWFPLGLAALGLALVPLTSMLLGSIFDSITCPIIGDDTYMTDVYEILANNGLESQDLIQERAERVSWFAGWREMLTGEKVSLSMGQTTVQQMELLRQERARLLAKEEQGLERPQEPAVGDPALGSHKGDYPKCQNVMVKGTNVIQYNKIDGVVKHAREMNIGYQVCTKMIRNEQYSPMLMARLEIISASCENYLEKKESYSGPVHAILFRNIDQLHAKAKEALETVAQKLIHAESLHQGGSGMSR